MVLPIEATKLSVEVTVAPFSAAKETGSHVVTQIAIIKTPARKRVYFFIVIVLSPSIYMIRINA